MNKGKRTKAITFVKSTLREMLHERLRREDKSALEMSHDEEVADYEFNTERKKIRSLINVLRVLQGS